MKARNKDIYAKFNPDNAQWTSTPGALEVGHHNIDGGEKLYGLRRVGTDEPLLIYTESEWKKFVDGARDGDFDAERAVNKNTKRQSRVEVPADSGLHDS